LLNRTGDISGRESTHDVVVIGGGGSGLAAAIEAATLGRSVVLLEKASQLGGSTGRSIGSISASATPHQIRKGIKDSPQHHFEDLGLFNARVGIEDNVVLRRILTDNVNETLRWLMSMGVTFFGPMPEPPHRKPRMHNVLPNSRAYIYHLSRRARKLGVDIRTGRRATRFLRDGDRVIGVECATEVGGVERYITRGGVVLASGDYSASPEFKELFGDRRAAQIIPTNPYNTGDGHRMVLDIGGKVINGEMLYVVIRFVAPRTTWVHALPPWRYFTKCMQLGLDHLPAWLLRPFIVSFLTTVLNVQKELFESGGILINKRGERFAEERRKSVYDLAEQPDQTGFIILDKRLMEKFSGWPNFVSTFPGFAYAYIPDYRRSRKDIFHEADTLATLAGKIGVDPAVLEETVRRRNAELDAETARGGHNEQVPAKLESGPYCAMGPVRSYVNLTDGGLAINERFQVLDADKQPIPGLFAAGSAGQGGLLLEGHGHHLGWAFTSGRFAGRNAAYLVNTPDI
jgi:succinate dehydrogenase/fumarate reductase flavoprotein subunit